MACRALVFGHSFVRNLDVVMYGGENPSWANLGLDQDAFLVQCYGIGGGTIYPGPGCMLGVSNMAASIGQYWPHVVFMQLGGNDLSRHDCDPEVLARDLVSVAAMFIDGYECVSRVVVGQLLPRFYCPSSRYFREHYNDLVVRVNIELDRLVSASGRHDIRFWRHRGFWKNPRAMVGTDGVHLNADGMYKYAQSIRVGVAGTARKAGLV